VIDPIPIGEDDLQAYQDRRLPLERAAMVEAYLAAHPEVAQRMQQYAGLEVQLAAALTAKLEEPIPSRLRIAAVAGRRRRRLATALGRVAAALLLVAAGAAGERYTEFRFRPEPLGAATANAVAAFHTFTVEVRHPVEVRAEDGPNLAQWLSSRLDRPVTPPDLSPEGFRLMGGRLLPTAGVPAAQLMYDDDHGTRLTVYVQPMGIDGEEFRLTRQGGVRTVYWAERRLALAVTGRTSDAILMAVARRVHDAVGAAGPKSAWEADSEIGRRRPAGPDGD